MNDFIDQEAPVACELPQSTQVLETNKAHPEI